MIENVKSSIEALHSARLFLNIIVCLISFHKYTYARYTLSKRSTYSFLLTNKIQCKIVFIEFSRRNHISFHHFRWTLSTQFPCIPLNITKLFDLMKKNGTCFAQFWFVCLEFHMKLKLNIFPSIHVYNYKINWSQLCILSFTRNEYFENIFIIMFAWKIAWTSKIENGTFKNDVPLW